MQIRALSPGIPIKLLGPPRPFSDHPEDFLKPRPTPFPPDARTRPARALGSQLRHPSGRSEMVGGIIQLYSDSDRILRNNNEHRKKNIVPESRVDVCTESGAMGMY